MKNRTRIALTSVVAAATVAAPSAWAHADEDIVTPANWRDVALDPEVQLNLTTQRYEVKGSTPAQIDASMRVAGSRATKSRNAVGMHGGRIGVRYVMLQGPSSCELYSHTVIYNAKTIVPRWREARAASDSTAAWWSKYQRDIEQHEQEHAFIAVLEVYALDEQLDALPGTGSCAELQADVKAAVNERSKSASHANRDFDNWTKNGRLGPYWLG